MDANGRDVVVITGASAYIGERVARMPERYPAIGDYALMANSNLVALISRAGSIY